MKSAFQKDKNFETLGFLVSMEVMKIEIAICAQHSGTITLLLARAGI
jgi:hypothetical protein